MYGYMYVTYIYFGVHVCVDTCIYSERLIMTA